MLTPTVHAIAFVSAHPSNDRPHPCIGCGRVVRTNAIACDKCND